MSSQTKMKETLVSKDKFHNYKNKFVNALDLEDDLLVKQLNQPKPSAKPTKLNKSDFLKQEKSISNIEESINLNEGKESRLKAFQMMKVGQVTGNSYIISKPEAINEEVNNKFNYRFQEKFKIGSKMDNEVFPGNISVYQKQNMFCNNNKEISSITSKMVNSGITPENCNENSETSGKLVQIIDNKNSLYQGNLEYIYGININTHTDSIDSNFKYFGQLSSICFHKIDKWIAYLNSNLIIVENFGEESNTCNSQNIINLNESKVYLDVVKMSPNCKVLMAYSTYSHLNEIENRKSNPVIIFYNYNRDRDNKELISKFSLLNKIVIKHKYIRDCEISPQNNICLVISTSY
jgi:hypothetical protein